MNSLSVSSRDHVKSFFEKTEKLNLDYNTENAFKKNCLNLAVMSENIDSIKFLLSYGARSEFALTQACYRNSFQIIQLLLEKGHSITEKDFETACHKGTFKIVQLLLQNSSKRNFSLKRAILTAERLCKYDIIYLFSKVGEDVSYVSEKTKKYISFCEKMEKKRQIWAANKIGSWWIPICYDVSRECGKRMMERSWNRVEEMYKNVKFD